MSEVSEPMSSDSLKQVAVVVPMYKEGLDADEKISHRHLMRFLSAYDKYLIVPEDHSFNLPGFRVKRFRDEFFYNTVAYSALLLSREFYQAFSAYKFILVYQLDALVFSDQLLAWCERDWDYIGAPWIKCKDVDFVDSPTVGNGGFSLRKVESFLKVIDSPGYHSELDRYHDALRPEALRKEQNRSAQPLSIPQRVLRRLRLFNRGRADIVKNSQAAARNYGLNEDYFWSFKAVKYYPDFKIASVEDGLRFSFEVEPRQCYALNNYQLPFGCHAWQRYDREFWEPFLLK